MTAIYLMLGFAIGLPLGAFVLAWWLDRQFTKGYGRR
jgi:hypothetical protein